MLEPIRHIISKQRIVLASGSPRRHDLLKMIGLNFEIEISTFAEDLDKNSFSHPCEYVKENAKRKAIEVWQRLSQQSSANDTSKPDLVIGADTVVTLYDEIIEKPRDEEDAYDMLKKLSGQKHTVFTGVALVTKTKQKPYQMKVPESPNTSALNQSAQSAVIDFSRPEDKKDHLVTTFHESTDVTFSDLDDDIIRSYIATGEPMDKAGAYGIQSHGATLIEQIRGDFYNVVGMPLHRFCRELYLHHCDL